jgi:ribonuclease BN (tRNA processing enzyme)
MSAGEAGELAKAAGAGILVATHLPHYGDHALLLAQAEAAFGGKVLLARSGLVLEL